MTHRHRYLNPCRFIVKWIPLKKLQWNLRQNWEKIMKNASENTSSKCCPFCTASGFNVLTWSWPWPWGLNLWEHWLIEAHICLGNLTIIVSDNGLLPDRHQAIIWTNAGILLIQNFSEISSEMHTFSLYKMHLKCHVQNGSHCVLASMY